MIQELTSDTLLTFGKHKGTTIGKLIKLDPSYLEWLMKEPFAGVPLGTKLKNRLKANNKKAVEAYSRYLGYKRYSK